MFVKHAEHVKTCVIDSPPTTSARASHFAAPRPRCGRAISFALLVVSSLVVVLPAAAQDADGLIRALLRNSDLGETDVSVAVQDLQTGAWLVERDADEPMIPASNMKLVTTAAALELLGPRFAFTTELRLLPADEEAGHGPKLAVIGSGDPALGDPKLLRQHMNGMDAEELLDVWVQQVVDTGLTQFDTLIVDDRVFDRQFVHPKWPRNQLIEWYCAPVAGINFHDNCLDILPRPAARQGLAPQIDIFPDAPFIDSRNKARTGTQDKFWVGRRTGTNDFTFNGQVRTLRRTPLSVTIHDPPIFFGQLLRHRLAKRGITVENIVRTAEGDAPPQGQSLHVIRTTLPLVLQRTNRNSLNMFAEGLMKRMGHQVTGAPGSFENGAAALRIYMHNALGPRSAVATVSDGSGLSRDNRLTARLLVKLLARMHESEYADDYRTSLAFAGKDSDGRKAGDGTLEGRFAALGDGAWVFGKSGYINRVSALSGYLVFPDPDAPDRHRVYAFSIICNGFRPPLTNRSMKKLQDNIVQRIEKSERRPLAVVRE